MTTYAGGGGTGNVTLMTCPPGCYTKPRALTPNIRRWMLDKGWLDRRTVTRLERPDPAHVALLYRIHKLEPAPGPQVDRTA